MRRALKFGVVLAVVMTSAFAARLSFATHVEPTQITLEEDPSPTCAEFGFGAFTELKIDPPAEGTFDDSIVVSNLTSTSFDFDTINGAIVQAVFVKGGSNGTNLYDYSPDGETSDTGLHAPDNPNGPAGISHMVFCYEPGTPPPPPPPPSNPPSVTG